MAAPSARSRAGRSPRKAGRWKAEWRRRDDSRFLRPQCWNLVPALTASFPSRASCAVIGMAGQNRRGPVDLFQKHHAHHLVRPGRGPERDHELSFAPQFGRKSVRPANDENYIRRLVAEAAQMLGKGAAVDALAALVQGDEPVFLREVGRDRSRLLGDSRGGIAGAAFRNFMNLDAAKAELAADIVKALAIALR